jgi:hypothetical protein
VWGDILNAFTQGSDCSLEPIVTPLYFPPEVVTSHQVPGTAAVGRSEMEGVQLLKKIPVKSALPPHTSFQILLISNQFLSFHQEL